MTLLHTLTLADEAATLRLGQTLAPLLRPGDVIALLGDLGSGKTALARAILRTLTGEPDLDVASPTFTLVQTYDAEDGAEIWHCDLYRLDKPDEALELGLEDAFHDAICLIEWPERLGRMLPVRRLTIALSAGRQPTERHVSFSGPPDWGRRLASLAGGLQ